MKVIFLCDNASKFAAVYDESVLARLSALTEFDRTRYQKADVLREPSRFADVEVIFSTWGMPSFTEEEIKRCLPALKAVFYAAGSVQSFARPFLALGVRIFSAWAANAVPVAEYTVAQIVLAGKDFYQQTALVSQNRRAEAAARLGRHVGNYRKRIGLIGCGMIGSMVAQRLQAYDVEVLAYDPFLSPERAEQLSVRLTSLEELFSTCSVVSNHLANNEATKGMLDDRLFASLPPYATFINTGRGAQVVEDALVKVLSARPDLTAVLDVTYPEPSPTGHPFYALENCFLTPHVAGSLGGEVVRMSEYMVEEYRAFATGQPCRYEVTESMLRTMA